MKVTITDITRMPNIFPGAGNEKHFLVQYQTEGGKTRLLEWKGQALDEDAIRRAIEKQETEEQGLIGKEIEISV